MTVNTFCQCPYSFLSSTDACSLSCIERERGEGHYRVYPHYNSYTQTATSLKMLITRNEPPTHTLATFLAEITFLLHSKGLPFILVRLYIKRERHNDDGESVRKAHLLLFEQAAILLFRWPGYCACAIDFPA